jgi:hypothetical protein
MNILVDLSSHILNDPKIIQVDKTPDALSTIPINGKYVVYSVDDFPVDSTSYVLNPISHTLDGQDVVSTAFAHLLAKYPMYSNIYFNPLLIKEHVEEIDFFTPFRKWNVGLNDYVEYYTRCQTGRGGLTETGNAPNHTSLLPINTTVTPSKPGLIVTTEIDISSFTASLGADNFMVFWKIYEFSTSADISNGTVNTPAIRTLTEVDQEPANFSVYISPNSGNWTQVGLLEPVSFCEKTTSFRLAFENTSAEKVYLASFAVLF